GLASPTPVYSLSLHDALPISLANEITQPFPQVASPLGPLAPLVGKWVGPGMNVIWRPNHTPADQDRFLELNLTSDQIEFTEINRSEEHTSELQSLRHLVCRLL